MPWCGLTLKTLCSVNQASHTRTNSVWLHWYEVSRAVKFWESEREWWLPGTGAMGELSFNGHRVSAWEDGKSSGAGRWWWLRDNVSALTATELYRSKRLQCYILCVFYHNICNLKYIAFQNCDKPRKFVLDCLWWDEKDGSLADRPPWSTKLGLSECLFSKLTSENVLLAGSLFEAVLS